MMITKKSIILERGGYDQAIRQIVKDIITVYKNEGEGEFYLPEHVDEESMEYEFPNLNVSLELMIEEDESIDDYKVNAAIWKDEDVISITINYNPKVKDKIIYDLIGSLNEVIAHELRHYKQRETNLYDLYSKEEPEDPFEYYTQPHEIDAQVEGFKRMSRITRRPFEELVRNWFKTHKDIHNLPDEKVGEVINLILKHKN